MSNYEVMLIVDPKSDEKIISDIAKTTFKLIDDIKITKLERTELAYEINKSKTATYIVVNIKATGDEINEFVRKTNINKSIWRILSINLDSEKGLNRKAKAKKVKRNVSLLRRNQDKKASKQSNENPSQDSQSNVKETENNKKITKKQEIAKKTEKDTKKKTKSTKVKKEE